jgi:hypothetical protein
MRLTSGFDPRIETRIVERYHRTSGQECLKLRQPATLKEVCEVTEAFREHYNYQRPHQGRACGNAPPRVAFPTLPTLPALPERVDPDCWLTTLDRHTYLRRVGRDGCVNIDLETYSIHPRLAGCQVLLEVEAKGAQFVVWHADQVSKTLPIKGLMRQEMAIDDYLKYIRTEALAYERRSSTRSSAWSLRQLSLW